MGPLRGLKVVEFAGLGPAPFAAMMLADMGADVIRVSRPGPSALGGMSTGHRGFVPVTVDLKDPAGQELAARLVESSDVLIEGFRPGVMERLGLGPDRCLERRPSLVYARMTGYGQDGPLSGAAGHDINYISVAGVLGAIRRHGERPLFPLNLVGDFGGGGMILAFGVVCAVLEARASGQGQVVDAAMVDGAALLATTVHAMRSAGQWPADPGGNVLDSGAHFYEVYETADGRHVAVGALEPPFYAALCQLIGVDAQTMPQWDRPRWPEFKQRLAAIFRTRPRDEWVALAEGTDACLSPVLLLDEAPAHPHNRARGTFMEFDGAVLPAPAPRLSRTPAEARPASGDIDVEQVLVEWGIPADDARRWCAGGAVWPATTGDSDATGPTAG
ncbi:CaiB/BaiF CoA transferase family protein [Phytoactinopolyspora limicola]|uniref:CaiB/BaiF CoA transferase family protein n=1 Tax=Phytoactinopolyspora limicola TaxID=2715536 RepID=UPI00140B281E|nr:CaiB/BaiF CoA-transferase family protein [Phytoactinopolyspora limicola]